MKMKKWKLILAATAIALCGIVLPKPTAQAANTDYVMASRQNGKISADNSLYYEVTQNGCSAYVLNNQLYTRKGTGSWKCIASAAAGRYMGNKITTNGRTVYYAVTNSRGGCTIYSISVSGKNKKKVLSLKGGTQGMYRYGNKLYYNDWLHMRPYRYNLSTHTKTAMPKDMRIDDASGKYLLYSGWTTGGGSFCPLYSYNAATGKTKRLSKRANAECYIAVGSKAYFVEFVNSTYNYYGKANPYRVRSCKMNGTGFKTLTPQMDNGIWGLTKDYVEYIDKNHSKIHYRYHYKTKVAERVR